MAQNLLLNLISSDEENTTPSKKESDSTDTDSDQASAPRVKKQRSTVSLCNTIGARGSPLSHNNDVKPLERASSSAHASGFTASTRNVPKPKACGLFSNTNIYAFDAGKVGVINESDDDSDNEVENIFEKKKPTRRGKKPAKQKTSTANTRKRQSSTQSDSTSSNAETDDIDTLKEYKSKIVFIEDEDTEVESDTEDEPDEPSILSLSQTREPTPPPSPGAVIIDVDKRPTKSARMTRGQKRQMKKAKATVATIDHLQTILDYAPGDPDISIVEVTPTKQESERNLSVKIRSRSGIQRFMMKMKDSFADIIQDMANHEFVQEAQVSLFLNDSKIKRYDTPASLQLQVADIIECYIRKVEDVPEALTDEDDCDDPDVLKIQIQGKDSKSKLTLSLRKDDPLERIMREYCRKKQLSYDKVTFQFDGEDVSPHETPDELELETNYCIDASW